MDTLAVVTDSLQTIGHSNTGAFVFIGALAIIIGMFLFSFLYNSARSTKNTATVGTKTGTTTGPKESSKTKTQ